MSEYDPLPEHGGAPPTPAQRGEKTRAVAKVVRKVHQHVLAQAILRYVIFCFYAVGIAAFIFGIVGMWQLMMEWEESYVPVARAARAVRPELPAAMRTVDDIREVTVSLQVAVNIVGGVVSIVDAIQSGEPIADVQKVVDDAGRTFQGVAAEGISTLNDTIRDLGDSIGGLISGDGIDPNATIEENLQSIGDTFADTAQSVGDAFSGFGEDFVQGAQQIGGSIVNAGSSWLCNTFQVSCLTSPTSPLLTDSTPP